MVLFLNQVKMINENPEKGNQLFESGKEMPYEKK
jgi:hypothetical protein